MASPEGHMRLPQIHNLRAYKSDASPWRKSHPPTHPLTYPHPNTHKGSRIPTLPEARHAAALSARIVNRLLDPHHASLDSDPHDSDHRHNLPLQGSASDPHSNLSPSSKNLAKSARPTDEYAQKKTLIPTSTSNTSIKSRNAHDASPSGSRRQSRRMSRMTGSGSRLNIMANDTIPLVKSTFYIADRPPPLKLKALKFIEKILAMVSFTGKPLSFTEEFKRVTCSEASLDIFQGTFWLVHCLYFQCDSEHHQERLVDQLSPNYVQLFVNLPDRDTFMQYYPFVLARSIFSCFESTFPMDKGLFDNYFLRDIVHIGYLLYSGMTMTDSLLDSMEKKLFEKAYQQLAGDAPLLVEQRTRPGQRAAIPSSISSSSLHWHDEQQSLSEQADGPKKGGNSGAKGDDGPASLLLPVSQYATEHVAEKAAHKHMRMSNFKQLSPLVNEYLGVNRHLQSKKILEAIQSLLRNRHDPILTSRRSQEQKETISDEHRGVVKPAEDAKRRDVYYKKLHETYDTSKKSLSKEVDRIHHDLVEEMRHLENSRHLLMKSGEAAVSQLTMRIMEHQLRRKEVHQRNLQKTGYAKKLDPVLHQTTLQSVDYDFILKKAQKS